MERAMRALASAERALELILDPPGLFGEDDLEDQEQDAGHKTQNDSAPRHLVYAIHPGGDDRWGGKEQG